MNSIYRLSLGIPDYNKDPSYYSSSVLKSSYRHEDVFQENIKILNANIWTIIETLNNLFDLNCFII